MDEKKAFIFEYFIPESAKTGTYDYYIKYEYTVNSTNYKHEKTFEIDVAQQEMTQEDILLNITRELSKERQLGNSMFANVSYLYSELIVCKSALSAMEANNNISGEYRGKYEIKTSECSNVSILLAECNANKNNMYSISQIEDSRRASASEARSQQKGDDDKLLMIVVAGFVGWNLWRRKEKTVGGKGEGVSIKGATWK